MKTKDDFKNIVTEKIVNTIKYGNIENWICSFKRLGIPSNGISKKTYQGQNFLNLSLTAYQENYPSNEWLTFNQCNAVKGTIRKGEHGSKIIFWKVNEDEETGEKKPLIQISTVFNKAQTTLEKESVTEIIGELEELKNEIDILNFLASIPHLHKKTVGRAYYSREDNSVNIPPATEFLSIGRFYACYFHELTHMTGIEKNLNRECYRNYHTKEEARAEEELVAELGAAFLCNQFGIKGNLQHAEYIASWLKVLEMNTDLIYNASIKASLATNFLNKFYQEKLEADKNEKPTSEMSKLELALEHVNKAGIKI